MLYWMVAFRRLQWNFSLQRAAALAERLSKPLVIFEPLRIGYHWASDRFHRFVIDGMRENRDAVSRLDRPGIVYFPYVEPRPNADCGLLSALARRSCAVVTDDFPSFFIPKMIQHAGTQLPVQTEAVDSNGLLPLRATERIFTTAFSFRAFLQKELPKHLNDMPLADPLQLLKLPPLGSELSDIRRRWPEVSEPLLTGDPQALQDLSIDHSVRAVDDRGGPTAARARLQTFLNSRITVYATGANDPDQDTRSGLSPYLHFGHIAAHELFDALTRQEHWSTGQIGSSTGGKREGWWGMSPGAETWLDELITWRELGYNMSSHTDNFDRYESLPEWAQATLEKHSSDVRPYLYTEQQLEAAETHDELWNAAQTQLVREGRIHNYLRMLWGKKILEWSASPQEALRVLIQLNNRYALDGRNPNSYSGIFWTLGRYDRPWGPERPIFGTVRYMSSDNTRRKLHLRNYLARFGSGSERAPTARKQNKRLF